MSFTWIPFYEELARKVLEYEHRQADLCAFRRQLAQEGLKPGLTEDRLTVGGAGTPLQEIDPFSMFSSFNRGADDAGTLSRRMALLARMKDFFGLQAEVPSDLDGIPLVDNQRSVYFPFAYERVSDDVPVLWSLARQGVEGGRGGVSAHTFERALQVKNVGVAKLTIGLFWMCPWQFLPLDGATREYLDSAALPSQARTWTEYLHVVERCANRLGINFPAISVSAYSRDAPRPPRRYWAGGHLWGDVSHLQEFRRDCCWRLGYGPDHIVAGRRAGTARRSLDRFARVQVGDWLAIKGWGGRNDLVIHFAGEVARIDPAQRRLDLLLLPQERRELKGPPEPGDGSWADALLEIRRPDVVTQIFGTGLVSPNSEGEDVPTRTSRPDLPLNLILYGPPGSGKTWHLRNRIEPLFADRVDDNVEIEEQLADRESRAVAPTGGEASTPPSAHRALMVTFHPSFTYEDFVVGIRPRLVAPGVAVDRANQERGRDGLTYEQHLGVFYRACKLAVEVAGWEGSLEAFCTPGPEAARRRTETLGGSPGVLLAIDEINRGNVARILGELITLIEPDKRLGEKNEMIVELAGTGQRFGVPSNLWIIGTMNTADRSVVAIDIALRRRFVFQEMPALPDLLVDDDGADILIEGVNLRLLLDAVNARLVRLKDEDHQIGHSFFWEMKDDVSKRTLSELRRVFHDHLLPLLREYFYDDLGRVGLVLGPRFVKPKQEVKGKNVFAKSFQHELAEDLSERTVYQLLPIDSVDADGFKSIYE